ncbi:hypothetical protein [Sphingomonas sp.]|uniref:hypothetical protein n=1 Tax=Sphingomonas sp. TaxID=28214 RepID=UPI003B007328
MPVVILVQAVAGPFLPAPSRPRGDAPCPPPSADGEVVVCARDQERYRLRTPPTVDGRDGPPRAAVRVFGDAKLGAEAEQGRDAQGGPINRIMVRLKVPF